MKLAFHSVDTAIDYLVYLAKTILNNGYATLEDAKDLSNYPIRHSTDSTSYRVNLDGIGVQVIRDAAGNRYVSMDLSDGWDDDVYLSSVDECYTNEINMRKQIRECKNILEKEFVRAPTKYIIKTDAKFSMEPEDEKRSGMPTYFHDGKLIGKIVYVDTDANRNSVELKAMLDDASMSCAIQEYIKNDIKLTEETYMDYIKAALNARYAHWGLPIGTIMNVVFNPPATIVFWNDGTKTVVKCENEEFDPEKGLAMAIAKKFLGNRGNYFDIFKKWVPKQTSGRYPWGKAEDECAFGKIVATENMNRFYIELPDGYRLIFEDGEYAGRYNPESESDMTIPVSDNSDAPFIAGKRAKIVCASDCYHVKNIKPENRLYFNTLEEAIANGCRPCHHCHAKHKEKINEED